MAANFEAKLHAFRRTQDGVVISYVVHPNDVTAELATAALGTRYMIGFAEIGDDGKPREPVISDDKPDLKAHRDTLAKQALPVGAQPDGSYIAPKRPFASLPLSQQAAIRCGDEDFGKYAAARGWRSDLQSIAEWVRDECGVGSRSQIIIDAPGGDRWDDLESGFQQWLTDQRYAHVRRG